MIKWVVPLSVVLYLLVVPHTLEDFSLGVPQEAGVPLVFIMFVVATLISIQASGLYWIGRGQRRGYFTQAGIGLFWAISSGIAQLPTILTEGNYRSGTVSVLFVVGIVAIGSLLFASSLVTLRNRPAI